jgi:hypothetical protein
MANPMGASVKIGLANRYEIGILSVSVRYRAMFEARARTEAKLELPGHPSGPFSSQIGRFILFEEHLSHRQG